MASGRLVGVAALAAALAGCAGGGPPPKPAGVAVSGKVFLASGAPLAGGVLVLRPVGGIHGASSPVQPDGSFTLTDPAGERAVVPGTYQVYVRVSDPAQKAVRAAVPQRYQNTEDGDSDVTVEIPAAQADLVIRLKK